VLSRITPQLETQPYQKHEKPQNGCADFGGGSKTPQENTQRKKTLPDVIVATLHTGLGIGKRLDPPETATT